MDYGTFFFTNIASMTVLTVCICLLAWYNRRVTGMSWLAAGWVLWLVKLVLQGLEGKVPPVISGMLQLQLYLIAVLLQMIGLRWFVLRRPLRHRWPFYVLGITFVVHTIMFLCNVTYCNDVVNIPIIIVCGAAAWMLLKYGCGPFTMVSRVTAVVLFAEMLVAVYRAVLTTMMYLRPGETVQAHTNPRWLFSLAAMGLLAIFMVMCNVWFLVAELGRELNDQARTDPLTGALNRRAMQEAAVRESARSVRYGYPLSLIMLDVDHFKRLNDAHGHAAGDRALQALVRELKAMLRSQDLLARTGGEEFTILLPNTAADTGLVVAERVRETVEALEVAYQSRPIKFTVSVGVTQFDPTNDDLESMMRRADTAMYQAKAQGRNAVVVNSI
jgi:diguanylate cyclase (GGDEF)-like protein